mgnify:CR=1 FL=1
MSSTRPRKNAATARTSDRPGKRERASTQASGKIARQVDGMLGFYHQPHFGRPSLALDLMEEFRPVIVTHVGLGQERWPIELTLTRRDQMGFRMLLGRQALRGRAVVDAGSSFREGRLDFGAPRARKGGRAEREEE